MNLYHLLFFINLLYYFSIQHVLQFDGHFPLQHFNRTHSTQSLINTSQQNEMRKYNKKKRISAISFYIIFVH